MNAVTKHEAEAVIVHPMPVVTPMAMIERALATNAGAEIIEKLMALQERHDANMGRRAFDEAISKAKAEIPPIVKNRTVNYEPKGGGKVNYQFEDLSEIARTVDPILSRYGLSYRFRTRQDGSTVTVTCVLSHQAGYSEETVLSGQADNSGSKNAIQAVGSTVTYLQRYTLKAGLGLAATTDTDGATPAKDADKNITEDQYHELTDLIDRAGVPEQVILDAAKVSALHFIPQRTFPSIVKRLNATIAAKAGGAK